MMPLNSMPNILAPTMLIATTIFVPSFSESPQKQQVQIMPSRLDYLTQGELNQVSSFNRYPSSVPLLGWTKDEAEVVRNQLSSFLEGWDDPSMDIYNTL